LKKTRAYGYSGPHGTGYTLTKPSNGVIEVIQTRAPYRRHQVTDVYTAFDSSEITAHSYAFDGLGRATNAIRSVQPLLLASTNGYAYNARSEVIGADIETNNYVYVYDEIGNNLYTSLNAITNAYTVNNLNQYKAVTNLMDFTGFRLGHDADGNTSFIDGNSLLYDPENRLFAYIFGLNNSTTGTLRSAYVYDYLGRRVKKMEQECKEKDSGGIGHFTYWQTNAVTTYVYDGWNLVQERLALTNGTTQEVSYFWGKDLSGSLQGAGGVGGLLAASINGDFYFPCYDNNGNITAYLDESGSAIAYRVFDAFGNTVAKGGDMVDVFHFCFSTKYLDHDTDLYYYGFRYYSPMLQRWINRDPIEEEDGNNLYYHVRNNTINKYDLLGMMAMPMEDPTLPEKQHDYANVVITVNKCQILVVYGHNFRNKKHKQSGTGTETIRVIRAKNKENPCAYAAVVSCFASYIPNEIPLPGYTPLAKNQALNFIRGLGNDEMPQPNDIDEAKKMFIAAKAAAKTMFASPCCCKKVELVVRIFGRTIGDFFTSGVPNEIKNTTFYPKDNK